MKTQPQKWYLVCSDGFHSNSTDVKEITEKEAQDLKAKNPKTAKFIFNNEKAANNASARYDERGRL
mgnify:CR=1 FL=1